MRTLCYDIGQWHAEAQLAELEEDKVMAVISVTNGNGNAHGASKHTVVFQHKKGQNTGAEIAMLVRRLLRERRRV